LSLPQSDPHILMVESTEHGPHFDAPRGAEWPYIESAKAWIRSREICSQPQNAVSWLAIHSAVGCRPARRPSPLCQEVIDVVRREAGSSSEITVHNMMDARAFGRATALSVRSVPAVAIDGKLASGGAGGGAHPRNLR
jgi:glutaredoxin 3